MSKDSLLFACVCEVRRCVWPRPQDGESWVQGSILPSYTWPGSNWRPSACEADVIATRPQVHSSKDPHDVSARWSAQAQPYGCGGYRAETYRCRMTAFGYTFLGVSLLRAERGGAEDDFCYRNFYLFSMACALAPIVANRAVVPPSA